MMLLKVLLIVSYIIHCNANLIVCEPKDTSNPSTSPTTNPTKEPTTPEPTPPPTREPITPLPTKNPFASNNAGGPEIVPDIEACQWHPNLDVIILNDISCQITQEECITQQKMIGETILAIKSVTPAGNNNAIPDDRVAYFEFDANDTYKVINLTDNELNHNPVEEEDRKNFYLQIAHRQKQICDGIRPGNPALDKAIEKAYNHFEETTTNHARDRKIIIFSNCKADISTIPNVCAYADQYIYNNDKFSLGNIVMVNNGNNFDIDDTYIPCLVEYDITNRIFNNPEFDINEWDKQLGLRHGIKEEICSHPTPAPTTDPTSDPTINTVGQTPQRRRLTHTDTFDITSGIGNSPCITMEIKLETENLLPLNSRPDPASNIAVIGKAIANVTGGVITIPDTPIPDDNDDPNDFPFWQPFEFDASCEKYLGTPQMEQYYAPTNVSWAPGTSSGNRHELTQDRFEVLVEMSTANTAIYVYKFNKIPLTVLYTCENDITLNCGIYDDDILMGSLAEQTISSSRQIQNIEFEWSKDIELSGSTTYIIKFSGVYPLDCDSSGIIFGNNNNRRRLSDSATYLDGATATESASACAAGNSLARSNSMKAAVAAMCNTNQVGLSNVKAGLFRQHQSNSYVNDHLIKTGSITLINPTTLEEILNSATFPQNNVQDPCIAVDEDENIIYAIGGKIDETTAVNYIQACQLNTNDLTEPCRVINYIGKDIYGNLKTFELDKATYGATCLLWNSDGGKRLVVIGGMSNPMYEFQSTPKAGKLEWYKDIRIYTIPELFDDAGNMKSESNIFIGPSEPEGININQLKPINDMKPLLVGSNLYVFGGKTHKTSIWFVDRINLDEVYIGSGAWASQIYLEDKKALPMVDQTTYENQGCYAAYSGQTYLNYAPSGDAENTDMFQLFCNSNIPSTSTTSSRRLTDYDIMKLKQRNNKRLLLDDETETSEVVINKYKYELDGIWYNFTVQFELCYDNNNELNDAIEYYNNVIDDKPNGNKWIEYNEEISERILNCSLEAYDGWSNGFGAVNVWDLDISEKRFENEIDYTTHPKRRKARFWWNNIGNKNHDNDDWIDNKFDYTDLILKKMDKIKNKEL